MDLTETRPLRMLVTDSAERFQLRFAEQAATLLVNFSGVDAQASARGVIINAITERDILAAAALLKAAIATVKIGTVEIVYRDEHSMEPYYRVRVLTPEDHIGDVMAEMNTRRGAIESLDDANPGKSVACTSPVSKMLGFERVLAEMTRGLATVEYDFIGYRPTTSDEPPIPPKSSAMQA
jgi:translation elongation factor EF-G